ncbi:hypothetical protein PXNS11_180111 [Stutzerimonas xanthomarina]|nr:hypothetical protein PXNS11_180111 [Stutzerimonas xanthomarina]
MQKVNDSFDLLHVFCSDQSRFNAFTTLYSEQVGWLRVPAVVVDRVFKNFYRDAGSGFW